MDKRKGGLLSRLEREAFGRPRPVESVVADTKRDGKKLWGHLQEEAGRVGKNGVIHRQDQVVDRKANHWERRPAYGWAATKALMAARSVFNLFSIFSRPATFLQPWRTVEWSRPPSRRPISGRVSRPSLRSRYIAI